MEAYTIQITNDDIVDQSFTLFGMSLQLTLRYNSVLCGYQFDLYDNDNDIYIVQNKGLSVNAPALLETSCPFVVLLRDKASIGANSISKDDFLNRFDILFINKGDYHEAVRASY